MRLLPAGVEAALWLLFLCGCSASPVKPPTDQVSRILDPFDYGFSWQELASKLGGGTQPGPTADDAPRFAPAPGQSQQLEGGASWNGHDHGQASSSYDGWSQEYGSTGLLDDVVASYARSHSAPHSNEPLGVGQHGYRYAVQPPFEYQVRPDLPLVERTATHVQLVYGQQPSSSARFQQPAIQHDYRYEQGPPNQQPTSPATWTLPHDAYQYVERVHKLQKARTALALLLDHERGKNLFPVEREAKPRKNSSKPSVYHASEKVKAEFGELLQQRLQVLFPDKGGEVERVTPTSPEPSIYSGIQRRAQRLQGLYVEGSDHVYETFPGRPYVGEVQSGNGLNTDFWAGRWLVRSHLLDPSDSSPKTPGKVWIRAEAILPKREAESTAKGEPTRLFIGDYEVPELAAPPGLNKTGPVKRSTSGPGASEDPSAPPSELARDERKRSRRKTSGR